MSIELLVTIIIAIAGWIWAIIQISSKRKWQKKDAIREKRYEDYRCFMKKIDEINENMRKNPTSILNLPGDFLVQVLKPDVDTNQVLIDFNQKIMDYVKKASEPLMIIKQEISALTLISSTELQKKLDRLKSLIVDFNNEMQSCLSKIDVKNLGSFKVLEPFAHDIRWKEFEALNEEIVALMRKELEVK